MSDYIPPPSMLAGLQGFLLVYNDRPLSLRGIRITERHEQLPTYAVDVDHEVGTGDTFETALLHAARRADALARIQEVRRGDS